MLAKMTDFALFREPHAKHATRYVQVQGEAQCLPNYGALNHAEGFVFAPFAIDDDCPLLVIAPDKVEQLDVETHVSNIAHNTSIDKLTSISDNQQPVSSSYQDSFRRFHQQLTQGQFAKIVLSRAEEVGLAHAPNAEELFWRACQRYPRLFIALVSTRRAGTWLMATPEVLVQNDTHQWHTMALAGTMRLTREQQQWPDEMWNNPTPPLEWSAKNKEEQRLVAHYIAQCLTHLADNIEETPPYTQRAGGLVHLRSDFAFTLKPAYGLGDLVQMLHPTPAVCGLPKAEAWHFIIANEPHRRLYYSGFCGPASANQGTKLYVSLRCMQLSAKKACLYAGGGLLKDSTEEQEWEETRAKMETMLGLMCR